MEFHFLSASVPFAKTIDGNTVTPYPHITTCTSHTHYANRIDELYKLLQFHANQGHCLLKGLLTRSLNDESRAGATDPQAPTHWIVFDIDGTKVESAEQFVSHLPDPFKQTSYIEQISSTAFINDNGYKAHLFFLVEETTPRAIKNFLYHLNLTQFDPFVKLSTGNLCLWYPVDVQVNHNATPLYIAPPVFKNREDPIKQRFKLIIKERIQAAIPEYPLAVIKNLQSAKLTQLRRDIGLRGKQAKISSHGSIELLDNIEPMDTPRTREERGFVYLELNPGNPYSYYHPINNPSIIYNFKGEPAFLTRKGLPEYWETVKPRQLQPITEFGPLGTSEQRIPLIFRDRNRDQYYNGFKTKTGFELSACRSRSRLNDFAAFFQIDMPEVIPDWEIRFDPTVIEAFDITKAYINTFVPSPALQHCLDNNPSTTELPPWTDKILRSITGNDDLCYDHLLNWIAFIFQTRKKTGTAWVFHGTEGTGKGLFYNHILRPLFGAQYCHEKKMQDLHEKYNDWLSQNIILLVDESRISGESKFKQLPNLLKHLITETEQSMRAMFANQVQIENHTNVIFATNDPDALEISTNDRRYNVCTEQTERLEVPVDITKLLAAETMQTAEFFWSYKADEATARSALSNEAKALMHEARLNDFAVYCMYLLKGNALPFIDICNETVGTSSDHKVYQNIIRNWAERYKKNPDGPTRIKKDELKFIFRFILDKPINDVAFGRLLKRYKIGFIRTAAGEWNNCIHTQVFWRQGQKELLSLLTET